jgi:hypothetical protein
MRSWDRNVGVQGLWGKVVRTQRKGRLSGASSRVLNNTRPFERVEKHTSYLPNAKGMLLLPVPDYGIPSDRAVSCFSMSLPLNFLALSLISLCRPCPNTTRTTPLVYQTDLSAEVATAIPPRVTAAPVPLFEIRNPLQPRSANNNRIPRTPPFSLSTKHSPHQRRTHDTRHHVRTDGH